MKRIGFACKWIDYPNQVDGIHPRDDCKKYNTGATTVSWLNRQTKDKAVEKLWSLVKQNILAARTLVEKVGTLDGELRMVRLSSDLLPVYTEPTWSWFWREPDVVSYAEKHFAEVGSIARQRDVRLSFHPGQFTVLASADDGIVNRSIEEFEYHADMARWMGYGREFQDFKINVHISGRRGPDGVLAAYKRLSPEARNCITIENEEISYGLDDCLQLSDVIPIVLDIHHHWIREGQYIQRGDDRVKRVIDSWRGRRPVCHYSVSREDLLVNHCTSTRPDHKTLLESGFKKQKLRAHSDFMWNTAVNDWAYTHWQWADLMVESKAKNLASFKLHQHFTQL
jgi:UV DNA damage repair endonuclease